jgi:hypothetical protein
MMSFGMRLSPRLAQKLETRLTQKQKLAVANQIAGLRIALVSALWGVKYEPQAKCPRCDRRLTPLEILKGFNDNPQDRTTQCPNKKCNYRFHANLDSGGIQLQMYCPTQTLDALLGRQYMSPEEIQKWNPSLYHSAIVNFGSLKNAFARNSVKYEREELPPWHDRVMPFLGKLSDKMIGEVVGVSANIIGAIRRSYKIPAFKKSALADT